MKERLRELDLNLLVILDALFRCTNVSRAAEELQMSQSAVSHALKRLRILFDDELFIRSREGMAPTPKASQLSGYVAEIVRLARLTMLSGQTFNPTVSDRTLSIALGDAGDMVMLPDLAHHIHEAGSGLRISSISCSAEEAVPLLAEGKLDVYVGSMQGSSSDILCQRLYEDRLVIIASARHKTRKTMDFEQYQQSEHIAVQMRTKPSPKNAVTNLFEGQGVIRKATIETPHLAAVPLILERNEHLISTVPISLAEYYRKTAKVKIIEPGFYLPNIEISQYWHRRYNNDSFVTWARHAIRDLFQNRPVKFGLG